MWLHFICNHVTCLPMPKIVFLCLPMIDFLCLPIPYFFLCLNYACLPLSSYAEDDLPSGIFHFTNLIFKRSFFFFLHDIILYFAKVRLKTLHHNKTCDLKYTEDI